MQGTQLTAAERNRLAQQRHVQSLMQPVLLAQVQETLLALKSPSLVQFKPEKTWFVERNEIGTTSVAEWMGF